jgi:hypothetical protein
MKKKNLIQSIAVLIAAGLSFSHLSCRESYSLYEDIETGIVSAQVYSHDDSTYTPVPDSLRLRFQPQLRMLRCTVVSEACDPQLEARLEVTSSRIRVRFDMHSSCMPDRDPRFDVDFFISPVHPDTFQLVVEQTNFSRDNVAPSVVLDRRIDVRTLPGF